MEAAGFSQIMNMVELMNSSTDPSDKVTQCDNIIKAIDELIGLTKDLLARDNYDQIPEILN